MNFKLKLTFKSLLLILILLGTFGLSSAQLQKNPELKMPCRSFKNGLFQYTSPGRLGITVKRRGKKHTEINSNTGEKAKFKVEWLRDTTCVYILTFKKSNRPSRLRKGWKIKVVMTETFEDYYDFKANRYGVKEHGSLLKILSKSEKRRREKEKHRKAVEAERIAKEEAIQDSLKKAGVLVEDEKKDEKSEDQKLKEGEKGKEKGKNPKKDKKKKDKKKGKKKEKGEKPKKEKKEKPKKEKKEKKKKPKKEKKGKKKKKEAEGEEEDEEGDNEEGDSDNG